MSALAVFLSLPFLGVMKNLKADKSYFILLLLLIVNLKINGLVRRIN